MCYHEKSNTTAILHGCTILQTAKKDEKSKPAHALSTFPKGSNKIPRKKEIK